MPNAIAASLAASLAWVLAELLLGHPRPIFAAITGIVCLSPGLPSRGRQAVGLLLGVTTGIVIGELALQFLKAPLLVQMSVAAFLSMVLARSYGGPPVISIQAGVSAVLVLALGSSAGGQARLLDVALGASIGLFVSQILMTPDPLREIDNASRDYFRQLAAGFSEFGQAFPDQDLDRATKGTQILSQAHDGLVALRTGVASARGIARWSLRGRIAGREVSEKAKRYDQHAVRLYAAALMFTEASVAALRSKGAPPPPGLGERLGLIQQVCASLAEAGTKEQDTSQHTRLPVIAGPVAPDWQLCVTYLQIVEDTLNALTGPDDQTPLRPS